jgi:hypothetical protein
MAVGIIGYQLGSPPPTSSPQLALRSNEQGLGSQQSVPAAHALQSAPRPFTSPAAAKAIVPQSDEQRSGDPARAASPRLTVNAVRTQQADEATRLVVSAADAVADAAVVIRGLARGSRLSAGTQVVPNTWRLAVKELTGLATTPPRGFIGAVDLTLELRLADDTVVDRKSLRLEWYRRPHYCAGQVSTGAAGYQRNCADGQERHRVHGERKHRCSPHDVPTRCRSGRSGRRWKAGNGPMVRSSPRHFYERADLRHRSPASG